MRPTDKVSNLINCLTNNEDERQDLWVHYLSGNPVESFNSHLKEINLEYSEEIQLREAVWQLIQNPLPDALNKFLITNFTDYERSIICFLMLGLDTGKISEVKGISEVRIRQSIASIRYNKCWEEKYGTEKKSDGSREVRT